MGKSSTNTTSTSSQPNPIVQGAAQDIAGRAQSAINSLTPQQLVPDANPDMQAAWDATRGVTGGGDLSRSVQTPYYTAAQEQYGAATQPLYNTVGMYESPYIRDVVNATQQQFDYDNAIQQQGIVGNAVAKGAWGGDRAAVAQGITAYGQQKAQAPVIAGLYNQGYNTALSAAEAQNWQRLQAAQGEQALGAGQLSTALAAWNALYGTGQQQYGLQQAQNTIPLQIPQYEAGLLGTVSGSLGGTSSTTSPAASPLSQIAGLGIGGVGILGATGGFGSNGYLSNLFSAAPSETAAITGGAGLFRRGGIIGHYAPGGAVFGLNAPNSFAFNSADPFDFATAPVPHATSGMSNPLAPIQTTTQKQEGGGGGILGDILGVAKIAAPFFLRDGGVVGYAAGGGVSDDDTGFLHPRGGFMPSVFMIPGRPAGGGIGIPRPPAGIAAGQNPPGGFDSSMGGITKTLNSLKDTGIFGSGKRYPDADYGGGSYAHGGGIFVMPAANTGAVTADGGLLDARLGEDGTWGDYHHRELPRYDDGGDISDDTQALLRGSGMPPEAVARIVDARSPRAMRSGIGPPMAGLDRDVPDVSDDLRVVPGTPAAAQVSEPAYVPPPQGGIVPAAARVSDDPEVAYNNFGGMRMPGVPAGGGPRSNPAGWQAYSTPEAGLAGISHQLDRYASGATTGKPIVKLSDFISTWAPPSENDTPELIKRAARVTGLAPDAAVDLSNPAMRSRMIEAMIRIERGDTVPSHVTPEMLAKVAANPGAFYESPTAMTGRGGTRTTSGYGPSGGGGIAPTTAGGDASMSASTGIVPPRASSLSSSQMDDLIKSVKPNPWMALAAAGFGMAAGRSPQAMQNIGAGALEGLKMYEAQRLGQPKLVGEAAEAGLKAAQAYKVYGLDELLSDPKTSTSARVGAIDGLLKKAAPPANAQPNSVAGADGSVVPIASAANPAPVTAPQGAAPVSPPQTGSPANPPPVPAVTAADNDAVREAKRSLETERQAVRFANDPVAALSAYITHLQALPDFQGAAAGARSTAEVPAHVSEAQQKVPIEIDKAQQLAAIALKNAGPLKAAEVGETPMKYNVNGVTYEAKTKDVFNGTAPGLTIDPRTGKPAGVVTALAPEETSERSGQGETANKEREAILHDAAGARNNSALLTSLDENAKKFLTGPVNEMVGEFRRYANVVNPNKYGESVAARENFIKDQGVFTRQATHDVSPRAGIQEVQFIQKSLPSPDMSERGIHQVVNEFRGLDDYKVAKAQALQQWMDTHGGMARGFENDWNANAPVTPYTYVVARMAPEQRQSLVAELNRTAEGRVYRERLQREMEYAQQHRITGLQ